ncbi:hypothetical protein [Novosphingobium sp.]|nr:hypothetical protein [Novosphingobium sp.]
MDALRIQRKNKTVREIASEVIEMVPDLTEEQVFCLAQTKFLGLSLDADA